MANNCFYEMKAVAKSKEALERLVEIMKYKDSEYFIYRCFSAEANIYQDGEYYVADISGDVAWSCSKWFGHEENKDELIVLSYDKDMNETYGTSHYITLDILCERLEIALEVYGQESGCEFQEHYVVNSKGEVVVSECESWSQIWYDENDNMLDEPIEVGGFEYYGLFSYPNEIYCA